MKTESKLEDLFELDDVIDTSSTKSKELTIPKDKYVCEYCNHHFVKQGMFLNHVCDPMKKAKIFDTSIGQKAFYYYNYCRTNCQHRSAVKPDTFLATRDFNGWIKFTKWIANIEFPDVGFYMSTMLSMKRSINVWNHHDSYETAVCKWDLQAPKVLVDHSVARLRAIAEVVELPLTEVFSVMDFASILSEVQKGHLSGWLLFSSRKFKEFIDTLSPEQQSILARSMNKTTSKFASRPYDVEYAKTTAKKLGL